MTDEELKELVAGLAVDSAKLKAELREAKEIILENERVANERTAKNDAIAAKNEAIAAKNEARFSKMHFDQSAMSHNFGSAVEDYFYNSMADNPTLGGIQFDDIGRNVQRRSKRLEDEYDIVLYNGDCIALIECKTKAHEKDITTLIDKKVANFRALFPHYKDYKIYLGLASFSFYPDLEAFAREKGVAILKQKGEVMEIEADNLKAY